MIASTNSVDIPALKRRYPLGDVVEASGVKLVGRGRVRQGVCPFHEETAGSFTVYADSQRWYCFGCGLGGDVLDFIQRLDSVDLPEAIRRLQGACPVPRHGGGDWHTPIAPVELAAPTPAEVVRDPQVLTAAMRYYATQLRRSTTALDYLASRGISLSSAQRLGLGYSTGRGLREHLRSLGFDDGRLQSSGLFTDRGERFAGMIVVPEVIAGRVHWLAGRSTLLDAKRRFTALPGPKPVLGLSRLSSPIDWLVVTEGLFDWLTLVSWGLQAVGALGTQGLDKVAAALRGQPRVFLAFDSDDAGREASRRLRELLGEHRSRTVVLPDACPVLGHGGINDVGDLATHPAGRAVFLHSLKRTARVR